MARLIEDAELMARSVDDPAAFESLYERHGQTIRRYMIRRVGVEVGEDLAAEVFVRAFRMRGSYRPEHPSVLPWLFGVANHVISHHRRAESRRLKALQRLASISAQHVDDENREVGTEYVVQLRRLSAVDRDAFLLIVWGELSYEEAAIAFDVPIGTVKSRVARARRALAHALRPPSSNGTTHTVASGMPRL